MFTIDPIHPIYSAVVETIAVYPQITINELHARLKKDGKLDVSLSHLYRVVTRMVDTQVLIRVNGKLSLNLMWVSYLEFIADRAKKIMQHVTDLPLEPGEKRVYNAHTLFDVEAIWNHVLVSLYRATQEKQLFKYYSHAWWQLGRNAEEMSFYERLKERGIECHWMFGHDSFLDKVGAKRVQEVFPAILADEAPFPSDGYNLNVYGEYVVECILPEKVCKHFNFFFDQVKDLKTFDEGLFLDVFAMRGKYKVTVWRNAEQANLLRAKLRPYFAKKK